jgi:type IV pilus assembly protein PilM
MAGIRRRQHGTHHAIGLDLGSSAVKMLQLRTSSDGLTEVSAAARVEVPFVPGLSPSLRATSTLQAIRDALRAGPFVGRRVIAAIPRQSVHVRTVRVTDTNAADFEPLALAEREAAGAFPFPLTSARVAFISAGEVRQGGEPRHEVIAAAAADQDVTDLLELLGRAGLDAEALDLEQAALYRAVERCAPAEDVAAGAQVLLDVGANGTQIVIGRGGEPCVVRTVPIGLRQMETVVARRLSVPNEDVRQLRARFSTSEPAGDDRAARRDSVQQALHDAMRLATGELLHQAVLCLRYYTVSFRGRMPARVWMTGGGAEGADLRDLTRAALGVPVEPLPLMAGVPLGPLVALDNTGPLGQWAVAYGLASRGVPALKEASEPAGVARA